MRKFLAAALLLIAALDEPQKTAVERYNDLEQRVLAAAKAGDLPARIIADKELLHLLNGSPQVVEALARAYAASGDSRQALTALSTFADLGQADEDLLSGKDQRLAALHNLPEFRDVLTRLIHNKAPVSLGKTVITLPDAGLIAEDMDYDPRARSFLVTSIKEKKIVRVDKGGSVAHFASSPDGWPVAAVKIDARRGRVWATEVAFDGFSNVPKEAWGRSAVLCFNLRSGNLVSRIEGPAHTSLGDMVLNGQGDPIVSDGNGGGLYLVSNGRITLMDSTDFISPQTAAFLPGADSVVMPDYFRGLARLDLRTRKVVWMNEDGADKVALNGVDGVYIYGQSLILTQNGTSPERVIQVRLDPTLSHVVSSKIIEQSTPGLDPTHGVVVGDAFYFIANSGWAELDEHGDVKPGMMLTPARIVMYKFK